MHHPQFLKKPGTTSCKAFFDDACRRLLSTSTDHESHGRYGFVLSGRDGGEWTLDVARGTVQTGGARHADVTIEAPATDFEEVLAGTLDVAHALATGRIVVRGQAALLRQLGTLLVARLPSHHQP